MIAVVTGGSGFIGRNLVDRLLRDGHTVRCLVRRPEGALGPPKVERHVVTYADPATLMSTAAFEGADVVFHLAGATRAPSTTAFRDANVTTTRNILGALVARRLRPRFVYVSSQAAAGPAASPQRPVDESDPVRPVEEYGRSKADAERIVEGFNDRLVTTIVRPCAVYGPRDRDFLALFRLAARGWAVLPGVRDHWLSLLHVDDVVDGLLRAGVTERAAMRTYFLASRNAVQWSTVVDAMALAARRRLRVVNLPQWLVASSAEAGELVAALTGHVPLANRSKVALGRQPYWVCSAARARDELGFQERVTLPEGIRETYLWYVTHRWLRPG
jgi:nucleoside-diphosphate-sugar epimerase